MSASNDSEQPTTSSSSSSNSSTSSTTAKVTATVDSWMPVGYWKFDIKSNINESCPICQCDLTTRCIECQADHDKRCGLSYGRCGHIYHVCCISGWISGANSNKACPYCYTEWHLVREELDHC